MEVKTGLAIVISVGTILGGLVAVDARYAKPDQVEEVAIYVAKVEHRLDAKINQDRANYLQERMWRLEDRYSYEKVKSLDEYRRLKLEWETLMLRLKK